jgi:hypothetical protein
MRPAFALATAKVGNLPGADPPGPRGAICLLFTTGLAALGSGDDHIDAPRAALSAD